jgi:DNA repair protein RadC
MAQAADLLLFPEPEARRPLPALEGQSDTAVLAAVLGGGAAAQASGQRLLARFGSLARLFGATVYEIAAVPGVTHEAALALHACQVLHMRTLRDPVAKRPVISSWSALLAYARVAMAGAQREQFRCFFLDKRNSLIADEVMNEGSIDHAPVYPREVVRRALELGASAIILAHNHPSGDPTPSGADIEITRRVVEACKALGIAVHDHIVVGVDGVASFKALGHL